MRKFFDEYFNIKKMAESKREYKRQMMRVKALPKEYRYVFTKIQEHMWMFAAGAGYDMMQLHGELLDLFEEGAAQGKHVLDITGEDVASFCEDLLRSVSHHMDDWCIKLNRDIRKKLGPAAGKSGCIPKSV